MIQNVWIKIAFAIRHSTGSILFFIVMALFEWEIKKMNHSLDYSVVNRCIVFGWKLLRIWVGYDPSSYKNATIGLVNSFRFVSNHRYLFFLNDINNISNQLLNDKWTYYTSLVFTRFWSTPQTAAESKKRRATLATNAKIALVINVNIRAEIAINDGK
jgi:hypothetical protein